MSELHQFEAGRSAKGWHRIEKAIRCLRLFGLTEDQPPVSPVDKLLQTFSGEPNGSDALVRGTLMHQALSHYYLRKQDSDEGIAHRWLPPIESVKQLAASQPVPELWEQYIDPITAAMEAYHDRWAAQNDNFKVVAVEHQLETVISSADQSRSHQYTQRADLIVEMTRGADKGKIFIYDHKTAYRIASNTLNQYILDGQFIGYQLLGYRRWGSQFGGVIINRVRLPKTDDEILAIGDRSQWRYYFARDKVPVSPKAIADLQVTIDFFETQVTKLKASGMPRDRWPGALSGEICWGKFGQCPKWNICHGR